MDYLTFDQLPPNTYSFETLVNDFLSELICFPTIANTMENFMFQLSLHNWSFGDIKTYFSLRYINIPSYYCVTKIVGNNFQIHRALSICFNLEKMNLSLYDNGLSRLTTYVGNNWEADKLKFYNAPLTNAKLRNDPRIYIHYESASNQLGTRCENYNYYRRYGRGSERSYRVECPLGFNPYLVFREDSREYDLEPQDPTFYKTQDIIDKVNVYFNNLIEIIKQSNNKQNEKPQNENN